MLSLIRKEFSPDGVFSELRGEGGKTFFQTLEHAYLLGELNSGHTWVPKIPPGTYICARGTHRLPWHQKDIDPVLAEIGARLVETDGTRLIEFETFEITGVEGHSRLLFHWGNVNHDSDGCVCTGMERAGNAVLRSREAFSKFMRGLEGIDRFSLTVA